MKSCVKVNLLLMCSSDGAFIAVLVYGAPEESEMKVVRSGVLKNAIIGKDDLLLPV